MNDADAILEELPDSAYKILQFIDFEKLKEGDKARYCILKTASLMKMGYKINVDSSMNEAYVFYNKSQTPSREAMLTHFIKALSSDSTLEKLVEYDDAIKYAAGRDSLRYVALAYANKALVYHDKYDYKDELENIVLAEKCISDSLDKDVVNHIYGAKGLYYLSIQKNDSALFLFKECLKLSENNDDNAETLFALKNIAFAYQSMGDYEAAEEVIDDIISEYLDDDFVDGVYPVVMMAAHKGEYDEALRLLGDLDDKWILTDKLAWYSAKAEIESLRHEFKNAFDAMNNVVSLQNEQIQEILRFDVTRQERNRLEILKDEALLVINKELRENRLLLTIILLCVVSCIFIVCLIREKHKRKEYVLMEENKLKELEMDKSIKEFTLKMENLKVKNEILNDDIRSNRSLINTLKNNRNKLKNVLSRYKNMVSESIEEKNEMQRIIFDLNKNIESLEKEISVMSEKLGMSLSLMRANFMALHHVSTEFCNTNNSSREKKCIAKLDILYQRYRDPKVLESLESEINILMEGVISIIRNNLSLSEDWIKILIYDICGFNYISISILMDISEKNASVRRSRLKEKCREIPNDEFDVLKKYIPMLSDKNAEKS